MAIDFDMLYTGSEAIRMALRLSAYNGVGGKEWTLKSFNRPLNNVISLQAEDIAWYSASVEDFKVGCLLHWIQETPTKYTPTAIVLLVSGQPANQHQAKASS